ncbi:MAG: Flp pilus assembly protein CpaB [Acidobacteria bacterium]|nr:Flp pilus assembly protein CpaB [Acidobacteriota bacterium]
MARIRIFTVLVIALTAGGVLAYGTYNFLQNQPVKTVTVPTTPVVVAGSDLQLGVLLKKDDVMVVEWPAKNVPEGVLSNMDDAVNRGLLAPVVKNEPLLDAKLAPRDSGAGLPPVIPQGMRAVSVRVNDVIAVAGYVLPGTRVDVLATATPTDDRADTTTKLVLSNVQVLAAGTRLEQNKDKAKPMQVTVVTLLVTPEQSERLALASTEGKIQLALRNPLDQSAPETPGVKPAMLLGSAKPALPPRPPAQKRVASTPAPAELPVFPVVEVIRGDKRATEVVK